LQGARQMADYQQALEMKTWEQTNYAAQMEQLKKAGLNPALIYGMGGAGGQIGHGNTTMPSAGPAPDAGMATRNIMDAAAMRANIELMEAQKQKTEAEAESIKGVETEEAYTRIA